MKYTYQLVVATGVMLLGASFALGSPISYTGGNYIQNFDGMGPTGTTTPTGWFVGFGTGGASGGTTVTPDTGSSTIPDHYNYGVTGVNAVTDRALGSKNDSGNQLDTEVDFLNNTNLALNFFTIGYTGEEWRDGGSGNLNSLILQYSPDGLNWTPLGNAFNFLSPINNAGFPTALDGNAAANRAVVGAGFSLSTPIVPGSAFFFRFADSDEAGKDDGLAIDDFVFSASGLPVPEPSTNAYLVVGGLGALLFAGRKMRFPSDELGNSHSATALALAEHSKADRGANASVKMSFRSRNVLRNADPNIPKE
jgi:hypothetical protein